MLETYDKHQAEVVALLLGTEWSNPTKTCSLQSFTVHLNRNKHRLKVMLGSRALGRRLVIIFRKN